jgi:DNA-binding transcriptional LysR family regulator
MQLSQLRHFLAVVETGSIRAAARRLGLSQPALTRSLRVLEAQLDTVLVRRTSRGVDLTEAGRLFLVRARNVHRELANAEQELSELGGRGSSAVSVGIASVIGALLVPGALERFHARRPDGHLRIVEGTQETLLPQLREGSLNLAACLRLDSESTAGFRVRPLAKLRLVVVGRRGHPLRHAGSLAALRDAQWLMIRPPGRRGLLEHAYSLEGLEVPPRTVHCDSQGIQIAILAVSDTVALMSRQMLESPSVHGLLEEIRIDRPLPLLTMALYERADVPSSAATRDLATALATHARQVLRLT